MIRTMVKGLIDLVYPPKCCICKKLINLDSIKRPPKAFIHDPEEILCPECSSLIKANFPPFCPKCSRHLIDPTLVRCNACAKHDPKFDFAWSACIYTGHIKDLIHHFKYDQKTLLRHILPDRMLAFIERYNLDINQFDIILPVPLHPTKLRERGYNQAALLAEKIAKRYDMRVSKGNLIRIKNTKAHAFLYEKERWTNIKGAFKIKNSDEFNDKNVLLLDDLLTTGATTSEAASVLKQAGANIVGVLTLAVTI